uniref:Uncharacterized protein n=1 Tax=Rhizophora mucronata TaxID=61149 RepID=A0A2P2J1N7_RHIMU
MTSEYFALILFLTANFHRKNTYKPMGLSISGRIRVSYEIHSDLTQMFKLLS